VSGKLNPFDQARADAWDTMVPARPCADCGAPSVVGVIHPRCDACNEEWIEFYREECKYDS
jgi:predicted Zn-ribbon and HTH transcriptional regulator